MISRVLAVLIIFAGINAQADRITGLFGFNQKEVNLGAQFEHVLSDGLGVGGFFHMASGDDDNGVAEVITFAANAKVHFNPVSDKVSFYAAPGVGMHMVELGSADENFIGPSLQWGILFHITNKASIGIENLKIYNWLEDEVAGDAEYLNAAFVFEI